MEGAFPVSRTAMAAPAVDTTMAPKIAVNWSSVSVPAVTPIPART